jgi:hypothetical protein
MTRSTANTDGSRRCAGELPHKKVPDTDNECIDDRER